MSRRRKKEGGIRKGLRRRRLPQSGQKQREDQRCLSEGRIDRNQGKYGRKEGANGRNSDREEESPAERSERGTSENRHKESHRYGWSLKSLTSSVARTFSRNVFIETLEAFARRALITSGLGSQLGAHSTGNIGSTKIPAPVHKQVYVCDPQTLYGVRLN